VSRTVLNDFALEIAKQIEQHEFDMTRWRKGDPRKLPTCGTALCFAGHIVAARRNRAKELVEKGSPFAYEYGDPSYPMLARQIWFEETGQACTLSFGVLDTPTSKREVRSYFRRHACCRKAEATSEVAG
jgi:hypothetical protein